MASTKKRRAVSVGEEDFPQDDLSDLEERVERLAQALDLLRKSSRAEGLAVERRLRVIERKLGLRPETVR